MKKGIKYLIVLVVIILSLVLKQEGSEIFKNETDARNLQSEDIVTGVRIKAEIIRSIDGDTGLYKINGREYRIRYLLIDTPETVDPNSEVEPFGPEASERSSGLLMSAEKIEVQLDEKNLNDSKGRLLAHIFVDGDHLQNILVKEGLAQIYFVKNPKDEYLPELRESEEFAKANHLGIWDVGN